MKTYHRPEQSTSNWGNNEQFRLMYTMLNGSCVNIAFLIMHPLVSY